MEIAQYADSASIIPTAQKAKAPTPPTPKPPRAIFTAANVLTFFTLQFLAFLWLDYLGIKDYPLYYTHVYLAVLAGVSLSNLLRRSRWYM